MKKPKKASRHLKATTINIALILFSSVIFGVLLFIAQASAKNIREFSKVLQRNSAFKERSLKIRDTSNFLIDQAKMFLMSGDTQYVENYMKNLAISRNNNTAMENILKSYNYEEIEIIKVKSALALSDNLVAIEMYAMKLRYNSFEDDFDGYIPDEINVIQIKDDEKDLSKEQMKERAIDMLFSASYLNYRLKMDEHYNIRMAELERSNENLTKDKFHELSQRIVQLGIGMLILMVLIIFIFYVNNQLLINPIKGYMKSISQDRKLIERGSQELRLLAQTYNKYFDLKAAKERKLKINAETDPLTGLLNRRGFEKVCLDYSLPQKIAFLIIDVDNFKHINDTFGHTSGDAVLKTVASLLKETFRSSDCVGRFGGDEFAVLLTQFNTNSLFPIEFKINSINAKLKALPGYNGSISISVGAARSNDGFSKSLLENADAALYQTKKNGKCGISFAN